MAPGWTAAVIGREDAQRDVVQHVVSRFFNNSPQALVLNLIESEQVDSAELDRLREIIDAARRPDAPEVR